MRGLIRRIQHPGVSVLLFTLLAVDFSLLPYASDAKRIARIVTNTPGRSTSSMMSLHASVRQRPYLDHVTCTLCDVRVQKKPGDAVHASILYANRLSGAWALSSSTRRAYLIFEGEFSGADNRPEQIFEEHLLLSHAEMMEARDAVSDIRLALSGSRRELPGSIKGEYWTGRERTLIWSGVIHNWAALALALCFVLSLGWIPRLLDPRRRSAKLLARGLCPGCRYTVVGLDRCPECGHQLHEKSAMGQSKESGT